MDVEAFPVESVSVIDFESLLNDELARRAAFPSCRDRIFFAHAAVGGMAGSESYSGGKKEIILIQ